MKLLKLELPGGSGVHNNKPSMEGSMDIFWNCTICQLISFSVGVVRDENQPYSKTWWQCHRFLEIGAIFVCWLIFFHKLGQIGQINQ